MWCPTGLCSHPHPIFNTFAQWVLSFSWIKPEQWNTLWVQCEWGLMIYILMQILLTNHKSLVSTDLFFLTAVCPPLNVFVDLKGHDILFLCFVLPVKTFGQCAKESQQYNTFDLFGNLPLYVGSLNDDHWRNPKGNTSKRGTRAGNFQMSLMKQYKQVAQSRSFWHISLFHHNNSRAKITWSCRDFCLPTSYLVPRVSAQSSVKGRRLQ